jgi:hypothetical protein
MDGNAGDAWGARDARIIPMRAARHKGAKVPLKISA